MKIIFITQDGYNAPTARIRGYNFANALKNLGVCVEVISYVDHLGASSDHIFKLSDLERFRLNLKCFLRLIKEKNAIFYLQKIDYHCIAPYCVSLINGNKLIADVDDWEDEERLIFGLSRYNLMKKIYKQSCFCVAASKYLYDHMKTVTNKCFYFPTVVDEKKFYKKTNEISDSIVFSWAGVVTGVTIFKSLAIMLEAFEMVCRECDNVKLEIAGRGMLLNQLLILINTKYNGCPIEYVGNKEPDDMCKYFDNIDVGLIPLIQNTEFVKSKSPTKMFEYMAKGVPVIASCGTEAENLLEHKHNGYLAGDKQEFFEGMKYFAENKDRVKTLGNNARDVICQKYCLTVIGKKLKEVITKECF